MTLKADIENLFKDKVLGHPAGLFVLFFTEMWERFSFYGMRVLLVNFLTMALIGYNPGWEWSVQNATALFGTYAMLLYITPILGGIIADKWTGHRWAVIIGALIMTLGHASMALETEASLYIGLALLVIGTGFFKPTMTSIISEMYKDSPNKKDGAYTIYYMGVNAGAFFGMMLCGYLAEKIGWAWGFGLAGIFMLLGTLQFWLSDKLWGKVGGKPEKDGVADDLDLETSEDVEPLNPFTTLDKIMAIAAGVLGFGYAINDPLSKIAHIDLFGWLDTSFLEGKYMAALIALIVFFIPLVVMRISRYTKITRNRMIAFVIFAFFTVFFWLAFEQGATSLVVFARDNVNRVLTGNNATLFNIVNALLTIIPLALITYVLILLWKKTHHKIPVSNWILFLCFGLMWAIVGWMLNRDFKTKAYNVSYPVIETSIAQNSYGVSDIRKEQFKAQLLGGNFLTKKVEDGKTSSVDIKIDSIQYGNEFIQHQSSKIKKYAKKVAEQTQFDNNYFNKIAAIENTDKAIAYYTVKNKKTKEKEVKKVPLSKLYFETLVSNETKVINGENLIDKKTTIREPFLTLVKGETVKMITKNNEKTEFGYLTPKRLEIAKKRGKELKRNAGIVNAKVINQKKNEIEITVSWFSILNSFFIIAFASLFSKWWDSKYNPSAAGKYALGLIIMAVGFGLLVFGAKGAAGGTKVSMIWLILAYLFHTLGELCLSPVGLSYVSKLVPGRMIGFMFGMWYIAIAIGNKLAAVLGGQIENITEKYDLATFFMIFTIVPLVAGVLIFLLNPLLKKLMHGVK